MFGKNNSPKQVAFGSALIIGMLLLLGLIFLKIFFNLNISNIFLVSLPIVFSGVSYLIFYFALERFIYQRIKLIYKSIYELKSSKIKPFKRNSLSNTVIEEVEQEVNKWKLDKQNEIEQLKKNETYRREFLGNVSHELKTPLFNIQGYIETLRDGGINDKNINKKYLKKASKNVERLTAIVKDLEFISKTEHQSIHLEMKPFNIFDLMEEIKESLDLNAKASGITIKHKNDFDPAYMVFADRERISQVLINLVINSIKYGKPGGITHLGCYDMDEHYLIKISDNGIGISKDHLPRLFERFYRVDSNRSREQGGTGLGLSIVKHIIESHDQTIDVSSTPGVGTSFNFTLMKAE